MAPSLVGCRLWTLGALPFLLLLLGQPAHGWVNLRSSLSPSRLVQLIWQKQEAALYRQATKVLQLAMDHLNEKHNVTYARAPGMPAHIMLENVFGRTYHVHTVLVEAKCPEGLQDPNPKDCDITPGALKLECRLEVTILFGNEAEPYIKEEGCQVFKGSFPDDHPDPEEAGGEGEEEATPYI